MALCIIFVPQASGTVSIGFVAILSSYLCVDVAEMIVSTANMKKGEFKKIKTHKYIVAVISLFFLIVTCMFCWKNKDLLNTTLTSFLSAIMVIIGCVITGLEGNKIATKIDGKGENNE